MRNSVRRTKVVALLATGTMLFQFGGCLNLESFARNFRIGFTRQIGAIPAQAVYDLTVGPLVDGLLGGGDADAG